MTDDEFDVAFRKVDTNGSGKIEFDEFFAWYTEQTEADKRMVRALKVEAELRRRLGTGELEPEEKRAVRSRLAMVELRRSAPSPSARPCCSFPRRDRSGRPAAVRTGGWRATSWSRTRKRRSGRGWRFWRRWAWAARRSWSS